MNKYLLLFTIGPVQSFIAQARKLQDLYAGSCLLSDLIDNLISHSKIKDKIIFPSKDISSKPNRFIAIIEGNVEEVKNIGIELENQVKEKFKEIANKVFNDFFSNKNKPQNFDTQIQSLLDVYWVALPYNENDYKSTYNQIEKTLGAIKNTRIFTQLEEQGRKCSLCGERNVLFYNSLPRSYISNDAIDVANMDKLKYNILPNEGLCAVCFTKRFYKSSKFQSIADICAMYIENELKGYKELEEYKNLFGSNFDGSFYYEENLTKEYFKKNGLEDKLNELEKIKPKHKTLMNLIKSKNLKLSKYYAVIMFDGDNMGKWLSGEFLEDNGDLLKFHKELSNQLGEYSRWAKNYLKEPYGQTIYAGGDDFLGFINLNYLFSVVKYLREKFEETIKLNNSDQKFTFSAGIVIAHYKTPLSEVLKWVRNVEKDAKNIDKTKNALAIAVLKHSGEIHKTVYKWKNDNKWIVDIMKDIVNELNKQDGVTDNFIKNLNIEFKKLMDKNGDYNDSAIIKTEITRLVKRSAKPLNNDIDKTIEKVIDLYNNSINLNNFLSCLNILDFISREVTNVN